MNRSFRPASPPNANHRNDSRRQIDVTVYMVAMVVVAILGATLGLVLGANSRLQTIAVDMNDRGTQLQNELEENNEMLQQSQSALNTTENDLDRSTSTLNQARSQLAEAAERTRIIERDLELKKRELELENREREAERREFVIALREKESVIMKDDRIPPSETFASPSDADGRVAGDTVSKLSSPKPRIAVSVVESPAVTPTRGFPVPHTPSSGGAEKSDSMSMSSTRTESPYDSAYYDRLNRLQSKRQRDQDIREFRRLYFVPEEKDFSSEERAHSKLHIANLLLSDGFFVQARDWLDQVMRDYPGTDAANEASKLKAHLRHTDT